jgi:hypothetical protein
LAAPIAALAATEILRDVIEIYREASGNTVDDRHQAAAV